MAINQKMLDKWGPYAPMIETIKENPVSLVPGYSLYDWFKEDKSKLWPEKKGLNKILLNSAIYTGAAARDYFLGLFWYAAGYGIVKIAEETSKLLK